MLTTFIKFLKTHTLLSLIILALFFRLYKVNNPIGDWHAFRQADTASVTREYVKHGITLLEPHYQDLSNIQSGLDNLEGYRMVEFPFNNALTAVIVLIFSGNNLVLISRLVSIAWSLLALGVLYYFVKEVSGKRVAVAAAVVFAVLPYIVYYSRAILPEPPTVALSMMSLWGFYNWIHQKKWQWWLVGSISLSLAMLLKPFVAFMAPVFAVILLLGWKKKDWLHPLNILALGVMGALAAGPFLWWRTWIEHYPSGIPANDWLFNGNGIRFRPAWARWLFWERITKLIFGFMGTIIAAANLLKLQKDALIYGAWWFGMFIYFIVIATGNVQHDYYQAILSPLLAITLGRGAITLYDFLLPRSSKKVSLIIVAVLAGLSWFFAWQQVKGYYNVNHWEYVRAGAAVDRLVPANAKVVAPAFGDTQFLFETNRTGWPIGFEMDKKIELGAQYYVTTSLDDEARELMDKYQVIEQTPEYVIINLQQEKTNAQ